MKTNLLTVLLATLLFTDSTVTSFATDTPADCGPKATLNADEIFRKIELGVATKEYEKVLTATYEAELELNLGPVESGLTEEQQKRWLTRAENKRIILEKMTARLQDEIRAFVKKENEAAVKSEAAQIRPPAEPSEGLQGTWEGVEVGREAEGKCTLTISGNSIHFQGSNRNEWYTGTFSLPAGTNPGQLIAAITDCPQRQVVGKSSAAIYKIEDGKLTLSGHGPGDPDGPKGFEGDAAARTFVFRKAKL